MSILNRAVKWGLISVNPFANSDTVKAEKKEAPHYEEEQVLQILNALNKAEIKYKVAIVLDLATGFRRGEILGLEWPDINFKTGVMKVTKSSQYLPDIGIFTKEPKTETSNRRVKVSESIVKLLIEYKTWQEDIRDKAGNKWIESNRLFIQWNGKPMHVDTLSAWFNKFLKANDIEQHSFHSLRNTSASLLQAYGLDLASISKRLGHSKTSTTADIYVHPMSIGDKQAADILGEILAKSDTESKDDGNDGNDDDG